MPITDHEIGIYSERNFLKKPPSIIINDHSSAYLSNMEQQSSQHESLIRLELDMYNLQGTKVPQRLKKLTLVSSNHTSSIKKLLPSPFNSQPNSPIQNNALPNLRFDIENYIYQMNSSKREEDFLSGKELTQRTNMIKSLLTEEKR